MKEHQSPFQLLSSNTIRRRDFLKWAGALGISAAALDRFLQGQGIAFASPTTTFDTTSGLAGYWPFDEGNGTVAHDLSGNSNDGTLTGGPNWTSSITYDGLQFNGSSTTVDINKSLLNTSNSYSIAAWVQLSDTNNWATAVSQDGNNVSGFFLQYTSPYAGADGSKFSFSLLDSDAISGVATRATSSFKPSTGTWYYLVGVHDASSNQIKLYVNGILESTQSVGATWNAGGETVIGRAKFKGGPVDFWPGLIDDVRVYNRALSDQDVANLYNQAPSTDAYTPIRPPATPLIVRSPYISTWLAADTLPGTWPTFWNGNIKAMVGIARIDGNAYIFLGAPDKIGNTQKMTQTNLTVTPTRSIFTLQAGGITLTLTFFSPVEANDIKRLSIPFSYMLADVHSNDGAAHTVSLYFDISGEWAHGDSNQLINWNSEQVGPSGDTLTAFTVTPNSPTVLGEVNEYPSWGTVVWATKNQPGLTIQSGQDIVVRSLAVSQGKLNNTMDQNMPRAINDSWPVFAFNFELGSVTTQASKTLKLALAHVREPAVSYLGAPIPPLWKSYWATWQDMLTFAYNELIGALGRATSFDNQLTTDATNANGVHYAALCSLALRQAFGGVELVNTSSTPWLFLKEISSDGNVSTVDVIYPSFPVFYYTNPYLLRLLLEPVLTYTESGNWPQTFCVHDLGSSYPNATAHNDGGGENMPVEETANMLLMAAAYLQTLTSDEASSYASTHYPTFHQWAEYLVGNALDPGYQNQTDDFTGFIAHSSNLALKGILAIGAMGQIAGYAGNSTDAAHYSSTASSYISQWVTNSQDSSGQHLKLAYDLDGTWSLKYNAFPDRLLGLNLIPTSVLQEEDNWYAAHKQPYGIQLDNRNSYTKADWELWIAASTDDAALRQFIVDALFNFANTTNSRVPFTDWYEPVADSQDAFQARPVIGGLFSILARIKSGH